MPSLIVMFFGKLLFHKSAIRTLGPLAATTPVQCNDAFGNAKLLTAKSMVVFAVVAGISKHSLKADTLVSLLQCWYKFRRIIAGAAGYDTTGKQIGVGVTDQSYFGPVIA